MKWTKERRYRKMEDATKEELTKLKKIVNSSPWRQTFHIQPETGLLNDPNGFSYYNGEYHLFYQWFPLGPVHGLKYWYHTKSTNLVDWENVGIGIAPNDYFDSHGAYSGSAVNHNGKLYLLYTGNTRDEKWERHPYQCLAVMEQNRSITKLGPVISEVPKGYTDHFRDPKVWKEGDTFFAILGAQRTNETGCVVLYRSTNLLDWRFEGEVHTSLESFGYMWECPDYFELDSQGVLIFSPQGLMPEGDQYQNIYQSGYVIGEKLNVQQGNLKFSHGDFIELDRGFDFYAPQTMLDPSGRRILVGWMGLPEVEYPTDPYGWAHCLTLPRELSIRNGKLIQKPVKELELLRGEKTEVEALIKNECREFQGIRGETYELIAHFSRNSAEEFGMELRVGENEKTIIKYDSKIKKVIFDRSLSGEAVGEQYGTARKCSMESDDLTFRIFVDVSSVEIFINDGEEVFTGRIFPAKESKGIKFFANNGAVQLKAQKWEITS
ncbi:glycoside hydrolase family 32 protein [Peribacillus tepidiphilus]|uniref:glycoside hydrolase family 32 protein n=1 Tax=Peribacillus tepidiphilus TaxID=2652445 RepID=UPI0012929B49|nr:sucrose-6-phosphate hydrolase [Peribacillus tepidiphilus]